MTTEPTRLTRRRGLLLLAVLLGGLVVLTGVPGPILGAEGPGTSLHDGGESARTAATGSVQTGSVTFDEPVLAGQSAVDLTVQFSNTGNGDAYVYVENTATGASVVQQLSSSDTITVNTADLGGISSDDQLVAEVYEDSNLQTKLDDTTTTVLPGTPVDSCTTITSPGVYNLTGDLFEVTASTCIRIESDDVVFDGRNHEIVASDSATSRNGLIVEGAQNVTVRGVIVRGFDDLGTGIEAHESSDVTLETVVATKNTFGIEIGNVTNFKTELTVVESNDRFGLQVFNSSGGTLDGVLAEDNAQKAGWAAVVVRGVYGTTTDVDMGVVYVNGTKNGGDGLRIGSDTDGVTAGQVTVTENDGVGIYAKGSADIGTAFATNNTWDIRTDATVTFDQIVLGSLQNPVPTSAANRSTAGLQSATSHSTGARSTAAGTKPSFLTDVQATSVRLRLPDTPPGNSDATALGRYVEVEALGGGANLDLALGYTQNDLNSVDESSLSLWRHHNGWSERTGSTLDTTTQTVNDTVTQTGIYGIFGDSGGGQAFFDVAITQSSSQVVEGDSIGLQATVTNTGGTQATQTIELVITDANGKLAFVDSVTVTLDAGESTTVAFSYNTILGDAPELRLEVASEDTMDHVLVLVEEGGGDETTAEPQISVPDTADFGNVLVGTSERTALTISNDGDAPLSVDDVGIGGPFSIEGSVDTVPEGETRTVEIVFEPSGTGEVTETLTVFYDGGQSSETVEVSGTGVESGLSVSPPSFSFGDVPVDGSDTIRFTVSNERDSQLTVEEISISGAGSEAYSIDADTVTLGGGSSTVVTVAFAPPTTGTFETSVVFTTAAGATLTVQLDGVGVDSRLEVVPDTITFGEVPGGETGTGTVTMTNPGDETLTIGDVRIIDGDGGPYHVLEGETTVGPGETVEWTVEFGPGEGGPAEATLGVFDAEGGLQGVVSLSGTGTGSELKVTPTSHRFPDISVDGSATMDVSIENVGTGPVTVTAVRLTGSPAFSGVENVDGFTLSEGESRTVEVTLAPETLGPYTGHLRIESDADLAPTRIVSLTSGKITRSEAGARSDDWASSQVQIQDVTAGDPLTFSVANPANDTQFRMENITVQTGVDGDMQMNVTTGPGSVAGTPAGAFPADNTTRLGNISVDASISNENIEEVQFTYTVSVAELQRRGASPEDVSLYRYNESRGQWVDHDATLLAVRDGVATYRTVAPGASDWTAAAKRPELGITDTEISIQTATTEDEVVIQVFVKNTGGTDGTFEAELFTNDELVDSEDATVPQNVTILVDFVRTFGQPNVYEVRVNDITVGEVEITEDEEVVVSTPDPDEGPASEDGDGDGDDGEGGDGGVVDGFGPGFGLPGALVAILVGGYLLGRRRSTRRE